VIGRVLVSAGVNRPWVVRAVALLLVLVGLQAGAFRDLPTNDERYYGTEDYSAAVRPEARKSEGMPVEPPAALTAEARRDTAARAWAMPASLAQAGAARASWLHPDPTGPPLS